ncbi:hypothetical protein DSO57_1035439 [Entomophthora muscae]|uniref:Uncharacterized protein n=1 Tax=Entomophthora muscae TaxID=34485 RepID=A0ACC2TAL0_9FUNG|nr:hypothetical protein DSO57_1035439 [Entomophthora muscae]
MSFDHSVEIEIPFPNAKFAHIAKQVLEVDKELKHNEISRSIYIDSEAPTILKSKFSSNSKKMIRVSINSFVDMLNLVAATQAKFHLDEA